MFSAGATSALVTSVCAVASMPMLTRPIADAGVVLILLPAAIAFVLAGIFAAFLPFRWMRALAALFATLLVVTPVCWVAGSEAGLAPWIALPCFSLVVMTLLFGVGFSRWANSVKFVLAALLIPIFGGSDHRPADVNGIRPLIILKTEYVDWSIADRLIARGELPNLAAFRAAADVADFEVPRPLNPYRVWGQALTGFHPAISQVSMVPADGLRNRVPWVMDYVGWADGTASVSGAYLEFPPQDYLVWNTTGTSWQMSDAAPISYLDLIDRRSDWWGWRSYDRQLVNQVLCHSMAKQSSRTVLRNLASLWKAYSPFSDLRGDWYKRAVIERLWFDGQLDEVLRSDPHLAILSWSPWEFGQELQFVKRLCPSIQETGEHIYGDIPCHTVWSWRMLDQNVARLRALAARAGVNLMLLTTGQAVEGPDKQWAWIWGMWDHVEQELWPGSTSARAEDTMRSGDDLLLRFPIQTPVWMIHEIGDRLASIRMHSPSGPKLFQSVVLSIDEHMLIAEFAPNPPGDEINLFANSREFQIYNSDLMDRDWHISAGGKMQVLRPYDGGAMTAIPDGHLLDVTPTILALMNLPVPSSLPGKPLFETR